MRRFWQIFRYEFSHVVQTRSYRLVTLLLMLALVGVLSYPRLTGAGEATEDNAPAETARMPVAFSVEGADPALAEAALSTLEAQFPEAAWSRTDASEEALTAAVQDGTYAWALSLLPDGSYRYIAGEADPNGVNAERIQAALTQARQRQLLIDQGVSGAEASAILATRAAGETVSTAADPMDHFLHTYAVIMLLYLAILLYGSMVASGVGAEKTTRTMELLITSARPSELMFGKVLGLGCAGLLQLLLVLGTGKAAFALNRAYWADNPMVSALFDMPLPLLGYALLFFVLGFFVYAFLYGAVGSLVNRTEELSSAIMPVTLLYVAVFLVVMMGISSSAVDGGVMRVASLVPFSSPMAMFARISMGQPAPWEIVLSLALLMGSVLLIGYVASGIYRLGVLLYGQKASPRALWMAIRRKTA